MAERYRSADVFVSLSEHEGVLRVATTDRPSWWGETGGRESESAVRTYAEREGRLVQLGRDSDWTQIHWITHDDNVVAQRLYDRIANRTDWVRYELDVRTSHTLQANLLPSGPLREPLAAARAAHAVLVYGSGDEAERIASALPLTARE
mgnify:CR=1 FL=1